MLSQRKKNRHDVYFHTRVHLLHTEIKPKGFRSVFSTYTALTPKIDFECPHKVNNRLIFIIVISLCVVTCINVKLNLHSVGTLLREKKNNIPEKKITVLRENLSQLRDPPLKIYIFFNDEKGECGVTFFTSYFSLSLELPNSC